MTFLKEKCLPVSDLTPVFHGTTLEICNGDGVVLGQRVTDTEVVLVERDGFDAHLQRELALLKLIIGKVFNSNICT